MAAPALVNLTRTSSPRISSDSAVRPCPAASVNEFRLLSLCCDHFLLPLLRVVCLFVSKSLDERSHGPLGCRDGVRAGQPAAFPEKVPERRRINGEEDSDHLSFLRRRHPRSELGKALGEGCATFRRAPFSCSVPRRRL